MLQDLITLDFVFYGVNTCIKLLNTSENELDGLSLRLLKDGDVVSLMPGKLGPARKLTLLCDELKAKYIQETEIATQVSCHGR